MSQIPPILPLPEEPGENETVLWNMIVALRRSMFGQFAPLAGWGTALGSDGGGTGYWTSGQSCPFPMLLVVGDMGQITVFETGLVGFDEVNARIGINVCRPAVTLDVYSNDCQVPVLALHSSQGAGIDFYPGVASEARAQVRADLISASGGRLGLYTTDSTGVLTERLRLAEDGMATLYYGVSLAGTLTPAQITANQNDYNPTGLAGIVYLRLSTDANRNITGLAGGVAGRIITIFNGGSFQITLVHEDTNSAAANRFSFEGSYSPLLPPLGTITLIYDSTSSRWRGLNVPANRLLSGPNTPHMDTVFNAPVRGDLIVANSTPAWNRFAIGAVNTVLWSNGTDPSWTGAPVLATSLTVPIIYGSPNASGTLTLFSTSHATKGKILFGASSAYDEANVRLGIGTITPAVALALQSAAGVNTAIEMKTFGTGVFSQIIGRRARGTSGAESNVATDDTELRVIATGWAGGAYRLGANIVMAAGAGTFSATSHPSDLRLFTVPDGSVTDVERFRVGPSGQWGIGGATYGSAGQYFRSGGSSAAPTWTTIPITELATFSSADLAGRLTDESGTGLAIFQTSPTIITPIIALVTGGTGVSDSLALKSTSGVGTTDHIKFLVGNNGATEAMRILNSGNITIGSNTSSAGLIRLPNDTAIAWRNAANSADAWGIQTASDNTFRFQYPQGVTNRLSFGTDGSVTLLTGGLSLSSGLITQTGAGNNSFAGNVGIGTTSPLSKLHINGSSGWIIQDEQDNDPTTTELDANDSVARYSKNNKLVWAYNNAGTMTYVKLALDGSSTTLVHDTTAP